MNRFNINSVIENYKLNIEELAPVLFPNVKYPKMALDRVIKGEGVLDIQQVEKLAEYIGVLVQDLFSADGWKASYEDAFTVAKGEYKVKVNYKCTYISVYKNNVCINQRILDAHSITVAEFIELLNNIIKSYENGNH